MASYVVESGEAGWRLDLFLAARMAEYSRSRIKSWIDEERARVDGVARKASWKLKAGERVEVEPAELKPLRAFAEEIPLEILYEDEDVVAVNKPAGLVVHAGAGQESGTLVNALLHHFESLSSVSGELRPGIVHRLDKGTSGVLLVARTDGAHRSLAEQFAARTVKKTYLAVVEGVMKRDHGVVRGSIGRDPVRRTRMAVVEEGGRAAHTEYRVLERMARHTLVEVRIGTGRTHQIRVHMASLGFRVAGDTQYGAARVEEERPWLHAWKVEFTSPGTGKRVLVEAPAPAELEAWKRRLL